METPEVRYARSGDVSIAYQVVGDGPFDVVYVPGSFSNVELAWTNPRIASFFRRLASIGRLILFDRRGTGLSDRVADVPHAQLDLRGRGLAVADAQAHDVRAAVAGGIADHHLPGSGRNGRRDREHRGDENRGQSA